MAGGELSSHVKDENRLSELGYTPKWVIPAVDAILIGAVDALNVTELSQIQGVVMVNHGYWVRHINGKTVNALISSKPSKIGKGITVNDTIVFIKKQTQKQTEAAEKCLLS